MNYIVSQRLYCLGENINRIIQSYGGIFVNMYSCPSEGLVVARVNPNFTQNIVSGLQSLGFVIGDVKISGIQSYIYIRGFMN